MNKCGKWQNLALKKYIIGTPVTALPFELQIETILKWARKCQSRYVCVANVHMLMEAYFNDVFALVLKDADLVTPDGMPLVWMLRCLGVRNQNRVAGMDIFLSLCRHCETEGIQVLFLGSQKSILDRIGIRLQKEFPNLQISAMQPLPFQPLTPTENDAIIQKINSSGAGLIFISLGCPKQEFWMHQNKDKVHGVMIGLGAVFPIYAGLNKRAPAWMQTAGLEWFFRLLQEPRRLWKRYWRTNFLFIYLAAKQIFLQLIFNKLRLHKTFD